MNTAGEEKAAAPAARAASRTDGSGWRRARAALALVLLATLLPLAAPGTVTPAAAQDTGGFSGFRILDEGTSVQALDHDEAGTALMLDWDSGTGGSEYFLWDGERRVDVPLTGQQNTDFSSPVIRNGRVAWVDYTVGPGGSLGQAMLWSEATGVVPLEMPVVGDDAVHVSQIVGITASGAVVATAANNRVTATAGAVRWDGPGAPPELIEQLARIGTMDRVGRLVGKGPDQVPELYYGQHWTILDGAEATVIDLGDPTATVGGNHSLAEGRWLRFGSNAGVFLRDLETGTTFDHPFPLNQGRGPNRHGQMVGATHLTNGTPSGPGIYLGEPDGGVRFFGIPPGLAGIASVLHFSDSCWTVGNGSIQLPDDGGRKDVGYMVRLDDCGNPTFEARWTDLPPVGSGAKLDVPFPATVTLKNNADVPITGITLDYGGSGLGTTDGLELVAGPEGPGVTTLAPGEETEVTYQLVGAEVGTHLVEFRATGHTPDGPEPAIREGRVQITPPVDVAVTSGQSSDTEPGGTFTVSVRVTNEWDQNIVGLRPASLEGPEVAALTVTEGPLDPDGQDATGGGYPLGPGESITFTYTVRLDGDFPFAEIIARLSFRDEATNTTFFVHGSSFSEDDLVVEVEGLPQEGDVFDVVVTLRNESAEPLEDVAFFDDEGLVHNPEEYEPETRGETEIISGPEPAPPAVLAPGESVEVRYRLKALEPGKILLVSRARADTPVGLRIQGQGSVEVSIAVCDEDEEALFDCTVDLLGGLVELSSLQIVQGTLEVEEAAQAAAPDFATATPTLTQASVGQHVPTMGEVARALMPTDFEDAWNTARLGVPAYYKSKTESFLQTVSGTVQAVYGLGSAYTSNFVWVTPEVRNANIAAVLDFAATEGGYQAEGIGQWVSVVTTAREGDLEGAYDQLQKLQKENSAIWADIRSGLRTKIDGQVDRFNGWRTRLVADPVQGRVELLTAKGEVEGAVTGVVVESLIGARLLSVVGRTGLLSRGTGLIDDAVDLERATDAGKVKRPTGPDDKPPRGDGGGPSGLDRPKRVEDIELGPDLDPIDMSVEGLAALLNGHPPAVQNAFEEIITELETEFDVELEIQARTAEKEGLEKVLNGEAIAKEQWNKAKSINFIDTTFLGAASDLTGQAAFYPPQPNWELINQIPATDPLRGLIDARIETQVGMWEKWSGEKLDPRTGAVLSISDKPSKMRLDFEKMLSDDGLEFTNSLRGQPLRETDGSLVRGPDGKVVYGPDNVVQRTQITLGEMTEVDLGGGRTAFVPKDRATGLPYGADVDIFAVLDANTGKGFTGSKRAQIELRLWQLLEKSDIPFGRHGWTHAGFELTDELSAVRISELYRVRPPAEAHRAVADTPGEFGIEGLPENPTAEDFERLERDIVRMQEKVGAGEYVINYKRGGRSVGYGALPNITRRGW